MQKILTFRTSMIRILEKDENTLKSVKYVYNTET